jgi:hypothetical protein
MIAPGLYVMRFLGQTSFGTGVLYIGHGIISGADANDVLYDGTYEEVDDQFKGRAVMSMPAGAELVTGMAVPPGQSIAIAADWPLDFANGEPRQITVEGSVVTVTLHKIRDLV